MRRVLRSVENVLRTLTFSAARGSALYRMIEQDHDLVSQCTEPWLKQPSIERLIKEFADVARQGLASFLQRFTNKLIFKSTSSLRTNPQVLGLTCVA